MNLAQNTFEGGLMMDLHPMTVPNTVLTNCLNGTYLTFNGNEYILLNDMGNGRVETAVLPSGYVPMGTTAFGGIIYIVSYNPYTNKCLIGCFPSPERNFTEEDLGSLNSVTLSQSDFISNDLENNIETFKVNIKLSDLVLSPGDKYLITSPNLDNNSNRITDFGTSDETIGAVPKYIRLRIATINTANKLVYLDSSVKWYSLKNKEGSYYILNEDSSSSSFNIDDYRSKTSSPYTIFNSKLNGNLYIVAELETINQFEVSYSTLKQDDGFKLQYNFGWKSDNWNDSLKGIDPKYVKIAGTYNDSEIEDCLPVYDNKYNIVNTDEDGDYSGRYNNDVTINLESKINNSKTLSGEVTFKIDDNQDNIFHYVITPAMEYGYLPQLKSNGTIDFDLVGSGKISLNQWRYYKQSDSIVLNYGFEAYPEDGKIFQGIKFEFYDLLNRVTDSTTIYPNSSFIDTGRNSYSGSFSKELSFDDLTENSIYGVKIYKNYISKNETVENWEPFEYRILYTNGIFNTNYLYDEEDDFKKLTISELNPYIKISSNFEDMSPGVGIQNSPDEYTNFSTQSKENIKTTLGTTTYSFKNKLSVTPTITTDDDLFNIICYVPEPSISIDSCEIEDGYSIVNPDDNEIASELINPESDDNKPKFSYNQDTKEISFEAKNYICASSVSEKEVSFSGKIRPVIEDENDLEQFGLSTPTTNGECHFEFEKFLVFREDVTLDIGYVEKYSKDSTYDEFHEACEDFANGFVNGAGSLLVSDSNWATKMSPVKEQFSGNTIIPCTFIDTGEGGKNNILNWGTTDSNNNALLFLSSDNCTISSFQQHIWSHESTIQPDKKENYTTFISPAKWYKDNQNITVEKGEHRFLEYGLLFLSDLDLILWTNNFAWGAPSKKGPLFICSRENRKDYNTCSSDEGIGSGQYSLGDVIVLIFMQTYYYTDEDNTITLLRPNDIVYIPSYTVDLNLKVNTGTITLTEDNIYINNKSLSEILNIFEEVLDVSSSSDYIGKNLSFPNTKISEESTLTNSIAIEDTLYKLYNSTSENKILVEKVVSENPISTPITLYVEKPENLALSKNKLYTINNIDNNLLIFDLSNTSKITNSTTEIVTGNVPTTDSSITNYWKNQEVGEYLASNSSLNLKLYNTLQLKSIDRKFYGILNDYDLNPIGLDCLCRTDDEEIRVKLTKYANKDLGPIHWANSTKSPKVLGVAHKFSLAKYLYTIKL